MGNKFVSSLGHDVSWDGLPELKEERPIPRIYGKMKVGDKLVRVEKLGLGMIFPDSGAPQHINCRSSNGRKRRKKGGELIIDRSSPAVVYRGGIAKVVARKSELRFIDIVSKLLVRDFWKIKKRAN